MALLRSLSSRLKPPGGSPPPPDAQQGGVQQARTRARQRLIGALLLLTVGVIGFPLLFESRPRPIPLDIPIEIPARDSAAPLAVPAESPRADAAGESPRGPPEVITETPADAGLDVTPGGTVAALPRPPPPTPAAPSTPIGESRGEAATRQPVDPTAARTDAVARGADTDAARVQALLDGKPVAGATTLPGAAASPPQAASAGAPGEARYIVQVGAFADPAAARETRLKVERLGLKTYTQVAETAGGPRTRVRVGPFTARAEADKAMARVKAAGVAAAILTL